jgi:hypothetical protein
MLVHAPAIQWFAALCLWRAKCDCTAVRTVAQAAAVLKHKSDEGVEMYSTTSLDGIPTIQRNGHNVLGVWDENWEFANEICDLLNSFEDDPHIFLTEHDRKWLKAMDRAFRKVQRV